MAPAACEVLVCPPASLIARAAWAVEGAFALGGQDCHRQAVRRLHRRHLGRDAEGRRRVLRHRGPFRAPPISWRDATQMSRPRRERRGARDLTAIICVGETEDRARRRAAPIISAPARSKAACRPRPPLTTRPSPMSRSGPSAPARRPATTTSPPCTPISARCLVAHLGEAGDGMRILYGGSVKPSNAGRILSLDDVNGALVGGASLKARGFSGDHCRQRAHC